MDKKNYIIKDDEELVDLAELYVETKGGDFIIIPMEDRLKLFLAFIKDCDYSKESFGRVYEFTELMFGKEGIEKLGIFDLDKHFTTFAIGDKSTKENKLIVLYNEKGIDKDINEKNTLAFEISFKDHSEKQISLKNLKSKINCGVYRICKSSKFDELSVEQNKDNKSLKEAFKEYLTLSVSRQI